jgi:hypothetical protein
MQTMKDKHDLLAKWGQHAVVIMGNEGTRHYEVVDLAAGPLGPEYMADFAERGLVYVGTLALLLGQFRSAFAAPLDNATVDALAKSYLEFIVEKFANAPQSSPAGDDTDWLTRIYNLPDNRTEMN